MERRCHVNSEVDAQIPFRCLSCGNARTFPCIKRVASKLFESGSLEQMTLDVEGIVDSGLDIQEALCRTW